VKNIFKLSASPVTLRRLAEYFCKLSQLQEEGTSQISSAQLAEMMDTNSSQLRQDFHHFGGFGKPGHPYEVQILTEELQGIFKTDDKVNILLGGATGIAKALIFNNTLKGLNFSIKGVVEIDKRLIGTQFEGFTVISSHAVKDFTEKENITIGAICTPEPAPMLDIFTKAGIKGIWNLSPVFIQPPKGITIQHENLAAGLLTLNYNMNLD